VSIMSLAELFYAKHPRRPFLSHFRQRKRADVSHIAHPFVLEEFEPRMLMAAGLSGVTELLAQNGDVAPASGGQSGGTLVLLSAPDLTDTGQAEFFSLVIGAASDRGIFRSSGPGLVTALARVGDAEPAPAGQTGETISTLFDPVLNEAGQVAFLANLFGPFLIFLSSGPGQVTALVREGETAPDGNGTFKEINFEQFNLTEGGAALFFANLSGTAGGSTDDSGVFLADGQEIVQIAREGQSLAGSTITSVFFASDPLTDGGQVGFLARLANGREAIVRFTPDLHWRATTSGAWDTNSNWTVSLTPAAIHDIVIDPLTGMTVTGPTQTMTVDSLTIGAQSSGTASLQLNGGGNLSVTQGLTIHSRGALDQQIGTVTTGLVTNAGSITQASGSTMNLTALFNTGSVLFNGQVTVDATLQNRGSLSVGSEGILTASGTHINFGLFILDNGVFNGGTEGFRNEVGGHLSGRGAINAEYVNDGTIDTTGVLTLTQGGFNQGRISIGLGEMLALQAALTSSGFIDLADGAITGAGPLTNFFGGSIRGSGSVIAPVTNQGLIHATSNGLLSVDLSGGNSVSGELQVDDGSTLNVTTAFTSAGTTVLKGASATLSGSGIMTNTGTVRGQGRITGLVANNGVIRAEAGTITFTNSGNMNEASGRVESGVGATVLYQQGLATNAGLIALTGGRFDNNTATLNNIGRIEVRGTFASGGLTNATGGLIHFADGPTDVFGAVTNNATLNVTNGTATFFNAVTNSTTGTIKNTGGVTRFLGGFTNSGAFISDPADNHFTDLTVSGTGYLVGGTGDRFIVTDELLNTSTAATNWNTGAAELIFQNGVDPHDFSIVGADHAGAVGGLANNFAWGTVRLAAGQTLRLQDGNATAGGALYVKNLVLEGGLSQLNSLTGNGLNIYYDSLAPANAYLGEQTYSLQNGGLLAPIRSLDFDANGLADALTDGILAVRHLFGFTGDPLTTGVVDPAGLRTSASALGNYLGQAQGSLLDVDGNGTADALSDGIVIVRYLFGFTGDALITGVVDPAGTRNTAAAIESFLAGFLPGSTAAASATVAVSSTPSLAPSSMVVSDQPMAATPTADLSLAYVQRSWIQNFVGKDTSVVDASDEEELLITLPV
jgi:hypothetical protein